MKTELGKLYELIEQLDTAMITTRRPDGHLESRPMANQKSTSGADLWFVTSEGTAKLRDLESDPHINLAYYNDRTREWISVSGIATVSRDRQKLRQLYAADWKIWDDPRMVLAPRYFDHPPMHGDRSLLATGMCACWGHAWAEEKWSGRED